MTLILDFLVFFQEDYAILQALDSIPIVALALRTSIEIFRVLSFDEELLTPSSLIDYVNQTEYFPLSVAQSLDLFLFSDDKNSPKNYNLKHFVRRFYLKVRKAVENPNYLAKKKDKFKRNQGTSN